MPEINRLKEIERLQLVAKTEKVKNIIFDFKSRSIEKSQELYNLYKRDGKFGFFTIKDGYSRKCPIIAEELNKLRFTRYYNQSNLKSIIDGEYWNGKIYNNYDFSCSIYLQGKKLLVYPPDNKRDELSELEKANSNLLYSGLNKIAEILEDYGTCTSCDHFVNWLNLENNKQKSVCSYRCDLKPSTHN